jgi:hypothetical protein
VEKVSKSFTYINICEKSLKNSFSYINICDPSLETVSSWALKSFLLSIGFFKKKIYDTGKQISESQVLNKERGRGRKGVKKWERKGGREGRRGSVDKAVENTFYREHTL